MDTASIADSSATFAAIMTPPESIAHPHQTNDNKQYPAAEPENPKPGSIYTLKSIKSQHVLNLSEGQISLSPPSPSFTSSQTWLCVPAGRHHDRDYLAFRNPISGRYLGRDKSWALCCEAREAREWERFRAYQRAEGRFVLLMQQGGEAQHPVGFMKDERLGMVKSWEREEVVWEFIPAG